MKKRPYSRCVLAAYGLILSLPLLGGCHNSDDKKPGQTEIDALRADPSKMPPEARKAMEAGGRPRAGSPAGGR